MILPHSVAPRNKRQVPPEAHDRTNRDFQVCVLDEMANPRNDHSNSRIPSRHPTNLVSKFVRIRSPFAKTYRDDPETALARTWASGRIVSTSKMSPNRRNPTWDKSDYNVGRSVPDLHPSA